MGQKETPKKKSLGVLL